MHSSTDVSIKKFTCVALGEPNRIWQSNFAATLGRGGGASGRVTAYCPSGPGSNPGGAPCF